MEFDQTVEFPPLKNRDEEPYVSLNQILVRQPLRENESVSISDSLKKVQVIRCFSLLELAAVSFTISLSNFSLAYLTTAFVIGPLALIATPNWSSRLARSGHSSIFFYLSKRSLIFLEGNSIIGDDFVLFCSLQQLHCLSFRPLKVSLS